MSRALLLALCLPGCVVRPPGEDDERERAALAGSAFARAFAERDLPALTATAPLADWIAHAERGNGELEAAWHRWVAALEQVPQDSTQPTTAMFGVEHRLDGGAALDRTAWMLMSDAMNNLLWPGKLRARGAAALERARVAAAEFDRTRLRIAREVAEAWWAIALRDEELRILERLRAVLAVQVPSARARVRAGAAGQTALLDAEAALDRVDGELARLRAGRPALLAALVARTDGRGDASPALPALSPLRDAEARAVELSLAHAPGLATARAAVEARLAELRLAEWQRVPEFSVRGVLGGDDVVTLVGATTLPFLRGSAIEASVRQATAEVHAARSLERQAGHDAVALALTLVATLDALEQESAVLAERLLPRLRQRADLSRAAWTAGTGAFDEWSAALAAQLEVERTLARLAAEHHSTRARLQEAIGGREPDRG